MLLYQPQNGYCYNSDTHFLFNFICKNLKKYKNIKGQLLDIGSGSGILGLLLARDFQKLELNQIEVQKEFQFLSQKNSQINKIKNKLYEEDFFHYNFEGTFDYIVSNPPFYPSCVVKSENTNIKIARYNDTFPLKDFIIKSSKILSPKGQLFFCYDIQLLTLIIQYCNEVKLTIENLQFLHPKQNKKASLVMIACKKNSNSLMNILPPAIMFDEDGTFNDSTNEIYKKCSTHSIKCELLN